MAGVVVEVRPYEVDGKTVLVMTVEMGGSPPCAVKIKGQAEYYVRRDATTFPARPEDIRESVLRSAPPSVQTTRWG